jgi:hypothetical protein
MRNSVVFGREDHWDSARAGSRGADGGGLSAYRVAVNVICIELSAGLDMGGCVMFLRIVPFFIFTTLCFSVAEATEIPSLGVNVESVTSRTAQEKSSQCQRAA